MRGIPPSTPEDWIAVREQLRAARIDPAMVDAILLTSGVDRDAATHMLRQLLAEDMESVENATVETRTQLAGLARILASKAMRLHETQGERSKTGTGRSSLLIWSFRLFLWSSRLSGHPMPEDVGGDVFSQGIRIGAEPKRPRGRPRKNSAPGA